jgi:hypothetical protein
MATGCGPVWQKAVCRRSSHDQVAGAYLHSLTSKLNLRTFGNTSLALEIKLSTFGTRPRVNWVMYETKQA